MSQQAGAFTSMVNFTDHKKQAASSTLERVILSSSNGSSFQSGQSCDIVIPGNTNAFFDAHSSYLRFSIVYNRSADTNTHGIALPTNGIFNCIKKVELLASGVTISSIDEYAKLVNLVLDADQSSDHQAGAASIQYGSGNNSTDHLNEGARLDGGATGDAAIYTTKFSMPLLLSCLASSTKYIPLMGDELRIRITFNDFDDAFISGVRAGTDIDFAGAKSSLTYSPVEMVMYKVQFSDLPMSLIRSNAQDKYTLILNNWTNSKGNVAVNQTSSVFQTGFNFTSASRVIFAFYPEYAGTSGLKKALADSERHKITRKVSDYCFNVSGKNIPSQKLKSNQQGSEVLTENKNSLRILGDFQHSSALTATNFSIEGMAAANTFPGRNKTTIGTRHYEIDLESFKNYADSDGVYSGISTIGQTSSVHVDYEASGEACGAQLWCEHQIGLSLDMSPEGSGTWKVIV